MFNHLSAKHTTIVVFNLFFLADLISLWERNECTSIQICKCLVSNQMISTHMEVVGRGRQTQLQVVKGPNEICMDNAGLLPLADVVHNFDWNQIAD